MNILYSINFLFFNVRYWNKIVLVLVFIVIFEKVIFVVVEFVVMVAVGLSTFRLFYFVAFTPKVTRIKPKAAIIYMSTIAILYVEVWA